jgi:hypothetical protein
MSRVPSDDHYALVLLAEALEQDALGHEAGHFAEIATQYDLVYGRLLPVHDPFPRDISIAMAFWDSWADASRHDWQYYDGINRDDWPRLARQIAAALRDGTPITERRILEHFDQAARPGPWRRFRTWIGL